MKDVPAADAPSQQGQRPASLQILADGDTHVIRRWGCIGEVLFADVSHSLFFSVITIISTDG